ncbi:MAG TPA: YlxR family protein [Lacisediminihabitans sp.]|uniref:YlxR family protein n=1 Tax=Lacisediminihabitans sp. TaxID=2787631 RepID=UPI002EDAB50A
MEPVRTCLGCRRRAGQSSLLRVVARDGRVIADPSASLPGRGAWVHPTLECVETSIKRKAFGRALRVAGVLDADDLYQHYHSHQSEPPTKVS